MALVRTVTLEQLPINQPLSLGSIKGYFLTLDITSYAAGGVNIAALTPLSQVFAAIPLSSNTSQSKEVQVSGSTVKVFTADTQTEVANDSNAGSIRLLCLGI